MTRATLALVVEDETLVRLMAIDMVEELKFEAVEAATAAEAMTAVAGRLENFAFAMIDIGLPDRPGDQLAFALRTQRANLPILIASGLAEGDIKSRLNDPLIGILPKPYSLAMLTSALKSLGLVFPS